tara:strand:- start:117 stop:497 length:381 start_codon:yes stop_codon:yes gene_type:complete
MKKTKNSNKTFAILFFLVFFIFGIWPIINGESLRWWSITISIIFLFLGSINSNILTPLNKSWIKLGELLGKIIAPIVMAIIYFVVITPIAIILKLFKKDLLKLKSNSSNTYWIKRDKKFGTMKKQF